MLLRHRLNSLTPLVLGGLALLSTGRAKNTQYISGTSLDGVTTRLALDRTPALYTGDFGDCLGGQSLLNVTKFDAAFYYDNSTILFHLDGTTNIRNESIMLYISVEAYGESRFSMTVNPCNVNIYSMCPLNAEQPVEAFALFPIGPQQVSGIPQIAYEVPDIEGYARIQIFANSSQIEIGCFQAVMRNGNSFSQPKSIGTVLGIFTVVAIMASFATAAYGVSIPHMRSHYAHSLSILVIFETFQSIFFSGALSLPWPSVLPAWWSNFAWAAGLVPSSTVVRSINPFVGVGGNSSQVGGAGSTVINNQGGLTQQIYGRSLTSSVASRIFDKRALETVLGTAGALAKRELRDPNNPYDYNWNGKPVQPGIPLPGDWAGFAGELSQLGIPGPNAFMVGLVWLLITLGLVVVFIAAFKYSLEGIAKMRWIKQDRLEYFRSHWTGYLSLAVLRSFFIAFFSTTTLAMFQFAIRGSAGPTTIAAIVFVIFVIGIGGLALYSLRSRLRFGTFSVDSDRILLRKGRIFGRLPYILPMRLSQLKEEEEDLGEKPVGSLPFIRWHFVDGDPDRKNVHEDEGYVKQFGWLSARYRFSRWWFFAFWLMYQFVRACFLGGGAGNPLAQVFGLFIVDILAFVVIAALNPYEGQRNTALAVWLLGLTRVATGGLSIAFLPDFNLNRIVITIIGVIIIVIQGLLTIALMILVIVGGISSWMSMSRNREYFSSEMLEGVRIRYFEHIAQRATDEPASLKPQSKSKVSPGPRPSNEFPEFPKEPYFTVTSVRRTPKIEDEDDDYITDIYPPHIAGSTASVSGLMRASRSASVGSRHSVSSLPRGARVHRVSWSSRDFTQGQTDQDRPSVLARQISGGAGHIRANSPSIAAVLQGQPSASSLRTGTLVTSSRPMTLTKEGPPAESSLSEAKETEKDKDNNCLEDSQYSRESSDNSRVALMR